MDNWNYFFKESENQLLWDLDWLGDDELPNLPWCVDEHNPNWGSNSFLFPSTVPFDKCVSPTNWMKESSNTTRRLFSDPSWEAQNNDSRLRARRGVPCNVSSNSARPPTNVSIHPCGLPNSRGGDSNGKVKAKHNSIVSNELKTVSVKNFIRSSNRIGGYTPEERKLRILRFLEKRKNRNWRRSIKYFRRKKLADSRPRRRGRFICADGQTSERPLGQTTGLPVPVQVSRIE
ncbi:hypothetical protein ABG067_001341 [Albugo candida]